MFELLLALFFLLPFIILFFLKIRFSIIEPFFLIGILVFFSCITALPDLDNYQYIYDSLYSDGEQGFLVLVTFFSDRGIDFYQFYMLCHSFCLMLVYLSVKMMSFNGMKCLVLYLFYPFLLDVIQIRNAIFMSLALVAFAFCSRIKNKLLECVVWVLLILLAGTQHYSAYAFLPAVFVWSKSKWLEKLPFIMFFITSFLILIDGSSLAVLMRNIFALTESAGNKYENYMEKRSSLGGFLMMFKSILMIYVVWYAKRIFSFYKVCLIDSSLTCIPVEAILKKTYGFLLYSSIFWPLYVVGATFGRLMQNLILLVYIAFFLFCDFLLYLHKFENEKLLSDYLLKILVPFILLVAINGEWIWIEYWDFIVVTLIDNLKWLYVFR